MKIAIDQWAGSKGIRIQFKKISITLHPHLLADFRIKKFYPMKQWKEYVAWIYKNRRLSITEWDKDFVFLGFMLQVQKYKFYMHSRNEVKK